MRGRHAEFAPDLLPSETPLVQRNYFVKAAYQF